MYRLSLPIFFFLFFANFVVKADDLNFVKVTTVNKVITLKWEYLQSENDSIVSIYKCKGNCTLQDSYSPPIAQVKMDPNNLIWTDTDSDTSRFYYCIGWKSSGKSMPKNNMVLNVSRPGNGCENAVALTWNPYINMIDSLVEYKIWFRKSTIPNFSIYDSIQGEHLVVSIPQIDTSLRIPTTPFEVKDLDTNTIYYFVIEAVAKDTALSAFSNIVEYHTGEEDDTPVFVTINSVDAIDDKYLRIEVVTDFTKPFHEIEFWRNSPSSSSVFEKIHTTNYNDTTVYYYNDVNADPKKGLYHYKAIANSYCKPSNTSNMLSNIYLNGYRIDNYKDSVFFRHDGDPFINPAPSYELVRIVNGNGVFITNLAITNRRCSVNVEPFLVEGAEIRYQIRTEENGWSNTLVVEHEPRTLFPTAFDPQSINLENRTFYPIMQFPSGTNYLFVIYNRWGEELYRSTLPPIYGNYESMQGRWDGTYKGKECPPGIYAFKISYNYYEGSKNYTKSGTFMLVR